MDNPGQPDQHDQHPSSNEHSFDAPPAPPAPFAAPEPVADTTVGATVESSEPAITESLAQPEPVPAMAAATVPAAATTSAPKRKGGALPWVIAALAAVAAVVLGVLWAGANGDLDDTKAAKETIAADLDDTKAKVADLQSQLDDTKTQLETAQSDLDTAVDAKGAIQAQLDDVNAEVEQLKAQVADNQISDDVALTLGRSFTDGANPPLTDAEATCMGHTFYDEIGLGLILEVGISQNITPSQARQAVDALFVAADTCKVDVDRLPA